MEPNFNSFPNQTGCHFGAFVKLLFIAALSLAVTPSQSIAGDMQYFTTVPQLKKGTQVYIIGEVHDRDEVTQLENSSIENLKGANPNIDCYFAEMDPSISGAIDEFQAKGATYESGIQKFIESRWVFNLLPKTKAETLRRLQIPIVPIDVFFSSPIGRALEDSVNNPSSAPPQFYIWMRNQIMAENIRHYFTANICKRAIFVVGDAHTRNLVEGTAMQPVQKILKDFGISSQVIHVKFRQQGLHLEEVHFEESVD